MSDTVIIESPQTNTIVTPDSHIIFIDGSNLQIVTIGMQGSAGIGVPSGGNPGQVLQKNSSNDYDANWVTVSLDNTNLVPYSGATGNVDLGGNNLIVQSASFASGQTVINADGYLGVFTDNPQAPLDFNVPNSGDGNPLFYFSNTSGGSGDIMKLLYNASTYPFGVGFNTSNNADSFKRPFYFEGGYLLVGQHSSLQNSEEMQINSTPWAPNPFGVYNQYGQQLSLIDSQGRFHINPNSSAYDTYTASLVSEVGGQLLEFGVNFNQAGQRNTNHIGGYFRIETRDTYLNEFFSIKIQPADNIPGWDNNNDGTALDSSLFLVGSDAKTLANNTITSHSKAYTSYSGFSGGGEGGMSPGITVYTPNGFILNSDEYVSEGSLSSRINEGCIAMFWDANLNSTDLVADGAHYSMRMALVPSYSGVPMFLIQSNTSPGSWSTNYNLMQLDSTGMRLHNNFYLPGRFYDSSNSSGTSGQVLSSTGTATVWINPPSSSSGWAIVTTTSRAAAPDNNYIASNTALVTITLPATIAVGQAIRIAGKGSGGWKIAQAASQVIHFGSLNTTTGTTGYLASTNRYDCIDLLCITANTEFVVRNTQGNITIV